MALRQQCTWAAMDQKSNIHKSSIDKGKSACQNYQILHFQIWQLHWQQNTLLKITKIWHSQWQQNTLLENNKNLASHLAGITSSSIGGKVPW